MSNSEYLAFLETITHLRPAFRYCARMTGSVMDGEDVVQDALFDAYRKLEQFDDTRPLKPWLFESRTIVASISSEAAECKTRPR